MDLLKKLTVLLVEDDEIARESLMRYLHRRVGHLLSASNGLEGLELYRSVRPDIVLTDIQMPVMDGLSMTRSIRELDPEASIIITTGHSDEHYLMNAIDLGIDSFLTKPVVHGDLQKALDRIAVYRRFDAEIGIRNRIIQEILDWQPCFLLWCQDDELEYGNTQLMEHLGFESPDSFQKDCTSLSDVIRFPDPTGSNQDWIREILKDPDTDHHIFLQHRGDFQEKEYRVRIHHFTDSRMYVFAFLDPDQEALPDPSRKDFALCR